MEIVINVVGEDKVGILAKVSNICANNNANIIDVSQTVIRNVFTMTMIVEIESDAIFDELNNGFDHIRKEDALKIKLMHRDVFNSANYI